MLRAGKDSDLFMPPANPLGTNGRRPGVGELPEKTLISKLSGLLSDAVAPITFAVSRFTIARPETYDPIAEALLYFHYHIS